MSTLDSPDLTASPLKKCFAALAFRRVCTRNIKNISIRVDRAPQPVLLAAFHVPRSADRDHDLV